jgi:hypothetical protein
VVVVETVNGPVYCVLLGLGVHPAVKQKNISDPLVESVIVTV